jgi:hypothetical protein
MSGVLAAGTPVAWLIARAAGLFALALGHTLHTGTDLQGTAGVVFAGIALAPVLWLTFARILIPRAAPRSRPAPATRARKRAEAVPS